MLSIPGPIPLSLQQPQPTMPPRSDKERGREQMMSQEQKMREQRLSQEQRISQEQREREEKSLPPSQNGAIPGAPQPQPTMPPRSDKERGREQMMSLEQKMREQRISQEQREREEKSLLPSQNGAIPGAPSAAELKALIVSMTDKIKYLQIQSAQQKKENDNLKKDNNDLTTSKAKLEGELETAKKLNTTQAADIKEKKNQLDTLTKDLNDKKDECTKLSNKIKDLQKDGDGWGTFIGEAYKLLQNGDQLLDNWSSQRAGKYEQE